MARRRAPSRSTRGYPTSPSSVHPESSCAPREWDNADDFLPPYDLPPVYCDTPTAPSPLEPSTLLQYSSARQAAPSLDWSPAASAAPSLVSSVSSRASTVSSVTSRPGKPIKPKLPFRPRRLPDLLSSAVHNSRLSPWWDVDLASSRSKVRNDAPPWSLSLESYYSMLHPTTWTILGAAYEKQKAYILSLADWRKARRREGASEAETSRLWAELVEGMDVVERMFCRLYALHFVRNRYLERYRLLAPEWDDAKILEVTLSFETTIRDGRCLCAMPAHSVWPLPLPCPPSSTRLVILDNIPDSDLGPYTVPALSRTYTRTFSPMPLPTFCELYAARLPPPVRRSALPAIQDVPPQPASSEPGRPKLKGFDCIKVPLRKLSSGTKRTKQSEGSRRQDAE
ncbi:hypothetical protein JCM8097_001892 [Rhodosporidiobolus ruineniae]